MGELRLKTLIEKLKKGRREYFDEFYELTKQSVYFTVRSLSTDKFFIEDVMQDAYNSFLTNLGAVSGNPVPYLCTVAKNKALDKIKKERRLLDSAFPFCSLLVDVLINTLILVDRLHGM